MSTPSSCSDLDREEAGGLPADRMNARGSDRDVLAIAEQMAKKSFGHRAPADVSGTDEKNVFHGVERRTARGLGQPKIKRESSQSTRRFRGRQNISR